VQYDIPVWIERKSISDLIQRSCNKDHWYQLHQLRDEAMMIHHSGSSSSNGTGIAIFLLEGSIPTAKGTPYGSQNEINRGPFSHTIDCQYTLWLFIIRSILSTNTVRFIQSNNEKASLRSISALGVQLLSSSSSSSSFPSSVGTTGRRFNIGTNRGYSLDSKIEGMKSRRQKLEDRLKIAGVPIVLAKRISDEIGSIDNMNHLYMLACEASRNILVAHVVDDLVVNDEIAVDGYCYKGSASSWSTAIHQCFYSTVSNPADGRTCFDSCYEYVHDHATLLATIHSGNYTTVEEAINALYDNDDDNNNPESFSDKTIDNNNVTKRKVKICVPLEFASIFDNTYSDHDNVEDETLIENETVKIRVFVLLTV
jgi:hypothetical protein